MASDNPFDQFDSAESNPFDHFDQDAMAAAPPQAPARTTLQELKRQLGLTARIGADVIGTLPLIAMDAGVAGRNLLAGSDYDMPSKMYSDALDQVLPRPETGIEKGVNVAGQMILGSKIPAPQAAQQAPANFDPQTMRALALSKARDAGYVVPPSTTNPTITNRFLESWGGKAATAQDASMRNQSVTDRLVKADLGLKATDDIAEGTLATMRQEAANTGYKPVRAVGTIRLDSDYAKALDDIAAPYTKAESAFPGLNKNDVMQTVTSLKQKSVDTDTAVDSIALLRDKANTAYRAGDNGLGKAYKGMAKALEDAIERSLTRRGPEAKELLKQYRDARTLIAKTHSAEDALNPELGNFNAAKFAQMLDAGKPLSGGMKQAGQASQAFKQATRLLTDSGSVRNTDVILGGGAAAMSGNPLPLLYPFSRMAARDLMLSPWGQGLLATPRSNYVMRPETVMGAAQGLLGPE